MVYLILCEKNCATHIKKMEEKISEKKAAPTKNKDPNVRVIEPLQLFLGTLCVSVSQHRVSLIKLNNERDTSANLTVCHNLIYICNRRNAKTDMGEFCQN